MFRNWSGVLAFEPSRVERPADEDEVVRLVERVREEGGTLRPVGAGHSSMPLVETDASLVSLEHLRGLVGYDAKRYVATVRGGTLLEQLTADLLDVGLSMENLGDVDYQSIAGAISTGTHGTGVAWGSLAAPVAGLRMVAGTGEVLCWSEDDDGEALRGARISLGALGIITEVTLRVLPAFRVHERRFCLPTERCLDQLDELAAENIYFDFYWYPRRDEVNVRARNPTALSEHDVAGLPNNRIGWMREIIPHKRTLKFNEMEYALPREAGPDCFRAVRKRMLEVHRRSVAWRVLYRTVAAEDAYLSPSYQQDSATISVHQNAHLPFRDFFADIEPIFRDFGGRPHWAKLNTVPPEDLAALYPRWDDFCALRRRLDPDGLFLNGYLRRLFG